MKHYLEKNISLNLPVRAKESTIVPVCLNVLSPVIPNELEWRHNSVVRLVNRPKIHNPSICCKNLVKYFKALLF